MSSSYYASVNQIPAGELCRVHPQGTSTSTATGSEGFPGQTKNSLFVTDFSVGEFRSECYGFVGEKVPHEKQKGNCPRTFTNQEHVKEPVHKCIW